MRLIKAYTNEPINPTVVVKVYYNYVDGEYVCKLFLNGVHQYRADYFTDDKDDALGTAQLMIRSNS